MDMVISIPGGMKVDAEYRGFAIKTDQSEVDGGENSAPPPFALFLASIGTCAGLYVSSFCQQRNIPTENIRIVLKTERNAETRMIDTIILDIELPEDFPEKYKGAVVAAADKCPVKKHIVKAPEFQIRVVQG